MMMESPGSGIQIQSHTNGLVAEPEAVDFRTFWACAKIELPTRRHRKIPFFIQASNDNSRKPTSLAYHQPYRMAVFLLYNQLFAHQQPVDGGLVVIPDGNQPQIFRKLNIEVFLQFGQ